MSTDVSNRSSTESTRARAVDMGQRDADWPDWYAAYMAAEQAGAELPS